MNTLNQLRGLFESRREILEIVSDDTAAGTVIAKSKSGRQQVLVGNGTVGAQVYAEKGRVLGPAPNLQHGVIEV